MWKPGPMPPDTWNWGGVVPKGVTGGFYFADFCGDHVKIPGPDGQHTEVVKAEDVVWYDNSLTLPPSAVSKDAARLPHKKEDG